MPPKVNYLDWLNSRRNDLHNKVNTAPNAAAFINNIRMLKSVLSEIDRFCSEQVITNPPNETLIALYKQETK